MYEAFVQQRIHIPFYANLVVSSLGMDSANQCFDKQLFDSYQPILYRFNEVGFRTHSVHDFKPNAILVLGDSFTLGLGINSQDRYSDLIEKKVKKQVLNFSLNGASNDWIARKLQQLLHHFDPPTIVIHYTFSHRRERPNLDWFDDERTECEPFYSQQENFENWLTNYEKIISLAQGITIIHSFIPDWHTDHVNISKYGNNIVPPVEQKDRARDGFHYGPVTNVVLADVITSLLAV
jgi:hypothetical protein